MFYIARSVYGQLLRSYQQAVTDSDGRITEACEDIGFAIEWLTRRYRHQVGHISARTLPELQAEIKNYPSVQWYQFLPIDCANFLVTGNKDSLSAVLLNMCHHKRTLRDYVFDCVYFIAPFIDYDDPRLIRCTEKNLDAGRLNLDKNLYLIRMAKGSKEEKIALLEKWSSHHWRFGQVKEDVAPFAEDRVYSNPFWEVENLMMSYLLDFILTINP